VTSELVRIEVADPAGVFAARQLGRVIAVHMALDSQDQVRVATALSEVSRSAVMAGLRAIVTFEADVSDLVIIVSLDHEPPADGVTAATRLMDRVEVTGTVVRMVKRRPPGIKPNRRAIRDQLAAVLPASEMDELRRQNEDLVAALADLSLQKEQLERLNAELQETNTGVMALYGQLSDELEQTNRGVVALYAELDEKSDRLRVASESKDRFWANVSHELRTPLNSIIGLARLLAEPVDDDAALTADQHYQVQLIRNSATTLLTLVNDLLDVAKAESGRLHVDPAVVSLPALLASLRSVVRPLADASNISLVVSSEDAPQTILTDELALTGILRNLLSNGIKYTNGGEVRLSVRALDSSLEISVADTGIGIPAGQQERVFEEFYQVPGVRRGGTGLGLPYARRLATMLGGELTLTSEPGTGTTAVLRLPHGPAEVGTVLMADDDASFRAVLRNLLSGIAHRVIEVEDGAQALDALAANQVDLVLADLMMPGMDGRALLDQLPASMPAIVVTGMDAEQPRRAAALLRKDELTGERLAFTIRNVGLGSR
jgi:signal transduction histidine kinase/CheY-like chemotaxis protein